MGKCERQLTELDKSYIAGFVDGEGYIGIVRSGDRFILQVSIGQNDPSPLQFIQERYPGSLFLVTPKNGNPIFTWRLSCKKAAAFLSEIEPYLINKKTQAQVGIKFQSLKSCGRKRTPEDREIEHSLFDNVRSLNAVYRKHVA